MTCAWDGRQREAVSRTCSIASANLSQARLSALLLLASGLFVTTCLAQGPPPLPAANPPPDHPEVYQQLRRLPGILEQ